MRYPRLHLNFIGFLSIPILLFDFLILEATQVHTSNSPTSSPTQSSKVSFYWHRYDAQSYCSIASKTLYSSVPRNTSINLSTDDENQANDSRVEDKYFYCQFASGAGHNNRREVAELCFLLSLASGRTLVFDKSYVTAAFHEDEKQSKNCQFSDFFDTTLFDQNGIPLVYAEDDIIFQQLMEKVFFIRIFM